MRPQGSPARPSPRPHLGAVGGGGPVLRPLAALLLLFVLLFALGERWRPARGGESGEGNDPGWADQPWHRPLQQPPQQPQQATLPPLRSSYALADGPAGPPRYSTHMCINQKFDLNWHQATCKFDNICLNAKTLQFEYYAHPNYPDLPLTYDSHAHPLEQFSPHLLSMSHARIETDERQVAWRPVVKRQRFPERVRWAAASQALIQGIPVPLTASFGDTLLDVVIPLFNMQHSFGVYTPDAQLLIPRAVNGSDAELRAALRRHISTERPEDSLLKLTWDHDAAWVEEYAQRWAVPTRDGLVCFKTVLAGTGFLSRQLANLDALPYRQAVAWRVGLQEPPQERPVITILSKQGRRIVENTEAIHAAVAARYPHAKVQVVDFGQPPGMSVHAQVKLMSDTSVLLTPGGGLASVLTFLRPWATAIVMDYWHTGLGRSLQLGDPYFSHTEYLDVQYFPVRPEDYQGTSDRPACELVQGGSRPGDAHYDLLGSLVHCNLRFASGSMTRLLHFVDNAVLRWAARTGRYQVLASSQREQYEQQQQPGAAGEQYAAVGVS